VTAALLFAVALTVVPGAHARAVCPVGLHPVETVELFFGRGAVSDAEWQGFLDAEVTPRFPDGLSAWDVQGQWTAPDGRLSREPSKVVLLVLGPKPGQQARITALIEAYKAQFHQQSVLRVEHRDCAAF